MTIGAVSPRTTVLYQMLAPSWMVTSPIIMAPGAIKTSCAMFGFLPLNGKMGIALVPFFFVVCYFNLLFQHLGAYLLYAPDEFSKILIILRIGRVKTADQDTVIALSFGMKILFVAQC